MIRSLALVRTVAIGGLAAAAVLAGALFSGPKVAFADSPDGLASGQRVVGQTCTGSGDNYKCLYCIYADGIKDCFWVKVPEPTPASPQNNKLWVATVMPGSMGIDVFKRAKPHVNVGSDYEPYLQIELENTLVATALNPTFATPTEAPADRIITVYHNGKAYMLKWAE
jgi:hypothetical protein